jgi:hypothetical protein
LALLILLLELELELVEDFLLKCMLLMLFVDSVLGMITMTVFAVIVIDLALIRYADCLDGGPSPPCQGVTYTYNSHPLGWSGLFHASNQ